MKNPIKFPDRLIATMNLSGCAVEIGNDRDGDVILNTEENVEPIHFSRVEARMLIAALIVAVETEE